MLRSSVLRDDRATPFVVYADGNEIDVLIDPIGAEEDASRRDEGVGTVLHEQVIVFDRSRPVRGEAVFEAGADRATPTGVVKVVGNLRPGGCEGDPEVIVGDRRAALDVEQYVVGGPADLAREQAERVDLYPIQPEKPSPKGNTRRRSVDKTTR
jgi:hypothetical protein